MASTQAESARRVQVTDVGLSLLQRHASSPGTPLNPLDMLISLPELSLHYKHHDRSSSALQSAILTDEVEALLGVSPEPFQPSRSTPRTTNQAPALKPPCLAHGKLEIEHGGAGSGRCRTGRLRPPLGYLPLPFFLFHGGGAHAMLFRRFPCPSLRVHHCLPRRHSGHLTAADSDISGDHLDHHPTCDTVLSPLVPSVSPAIACIPASELDLLSARG